MKEVINKLKFKGAGAVINAPADIEKAFVKSGFSNTFGKDKSSNTLVFINSKNEFVDFLKKSLSKIEYDSVLWFAYPKGTSEIKTDINRDIIRVTGEEYGITTVTAISINDTWSGLRLRPIEKVGKQSG
jgi:hypothetical protein